MFSCKTAWLHATRVTTDDPEEEEIQIFVNEVNSSLGGAIGCPTNGKLSKS